MTSPAIPGRGRKAHPRAQGEGLPVWESPFRRGSSLLCWAVRDPLPPHPWKHPLLLLMPKARSASRNVVWSLNSQSCVEAGVPPEHGWAGAKDRSPKNGGLSRRERLAGIRSSGRTRVWLLWPGEVGEGGPQAALLTPPPPTPPVSRRRAARPSPAWTLGGALHPVLGRAWPPAGRGGWSSRRTRRARGQPAHPLHPQGRPP